MLNGVSDRLTVLEGDLYEYVRISRTERASVGSRQ